MSRRGSETPGHHSPLIEQFDAVHNLDSVRWKLAWTANRPLFTSETDLRSQLSEVRLAFEEVFSLDKFLAALEASSLTENRSYLKTLRKYGTIYKDTAMFFGGGSSRLPPALRRFVRSLGDFNDAAKARVPVDRKQINKLRQLAEQLATEKNVFSGDQLGSLSSFQDYARQELVIIRQQAVQPVLEVDDFHDLRQDIRAFMNLFQVAAAKKIGSPAHQVFLQLYAISHSLGKIHDKAVLKDLRQTKRYEDNQYVLDETTKKHLAIALESVVRAFGL